MLSPPYLKTSFILGTNYYNLSPDLSDHDKSASVLRASHCLPYSRHVEQGTPESHLKSGVFSRCAQFWSIQLPQDVNAPDVHLSASLNDLKGAPPPSLVQHCVSTYRVADSVIHHLPPLCGLY